MSIFAKDRLFLGFLRLLHLFHISSTALLLSEVENNISSLYVKSVWKGGSDHTFLRHWYNSKWFDSKKRTIVSIRTWSDLTSYKFPTTVDWGHSSSWPNKCVERTQEIAKGPLSMSIYILCIFFLENVYTKDILKIHPFCRSWCLQFCTPSSNPRTHKKGMRSMDVIYGCFHK